MLRHFEQVAPRGGWLDYTTVGLAKELDCSVAAARSALRTLASKNRIEFVKAPANYKSRARVLVDGGTP